MAEVPRNRLPSGHDEDFVNPVDENLICVICQLTLRTPVQTTCGHRYCKECLDEHFKSQDENGQPHTCPVDNRTLAGDQDIFTDRATERKILSFLIKCPSGGCEWTGELRYKETHLATCPFKDVPCTNDNCRVTLKRKDLSEHVRFTCEWRIIPCEYCSESHLKCQMEDHIRDKCKLFPLPCPYMCGTLTVRQMIPNHIEDDCPLTKIPCPYARIGCHTEVQRDQLESHLQNETRSHLDLACLDLNDTNQKVKEKTLQLDRLEATQKTIQRTLDKLENRLEETVNVIQQQHQNRVDVLQQEYQEKLCILEQKVQKKIEATQKTTQNILDRIENRLDEFDVLQQQQQNRVDVLQLEYQKNFRNFKRNVNNNIQTKLAKKLDTEFKIFFVCLLLLWVFLMLYLATLEERFQNNLEEKDSVTQRLHKKDVSMVKKYLEDKMDSLSTKVRDIQSMDEKEVGMIKNLENKLNSLNYRLGWVTDPGESRIFTWKVASFDIKLKQAKNKERQFIDISSDPFYMYGYKLRLRLLPNGDGDGENTHLAVFIRVMKGEYDALLPWPFKRKVKFTVIDQQKDPAKRENQVGEFTPGNIPECFARPIQEENPQMYGFAKLISHKKLHSRRYLVDDTLFLQVKVGP